jgi:aspartate/methionine/tyrosine aminotransferase
VKILKLLEENEFLPDLNELRKLVNDNTSLIVLNNPNNPTGSLMDEDFLKQVVEIARSCDAYLLCDEVYRGIDQAGNGFTTSVADLYEKGVSTSSMSKSFSLAGLRLGWLVGPVELLEKVNIHRDYNTISVGLIDDHFAAIALENRDKILARSRSITRENLAMLDAWIANEPLISYIKPKSATVALLKYDLDMSSREFCVKLLESKGVMLTPGSVMDMEGYVRIGFANNPQVMKIGLEKFSEFLAEL